MKVVLVLVVLCAFVAVEGRRKNQRRPPQRNNYGSRSSSRQDDHRNNYDSRSSSRQDDSRSSSRQDDHRRPPQRDDHNSRPSGNDHHRQPPMRDDHHRRPPMRDDHHRRPPMRDNHHGNHHPIDVNTVPLTDCSPQTLVAVEQFLAMNVPHVCDIIVPYCSIIDGYAEGAFYCQVGFRAANVMHQCCGNYSNNVQPVTSSPTTAQPTTTAAPTTTTAAPTTTTAAPTTTQAATTTTAARTCGQSTTNPATKSASFETVRLSLRIVGGSTAQACEYPGIAMLSVGDYLCGGTIIDETHILTAAHCVAGMDVAQTSVTVGEHDVNTQTGNEQTIQASQLTFHNNYNPDTFENDIAIITLSEPIDFNDCVQPVCLPTSDTSFGTGDDCTVAGWGTTSEGGSVSDVLQEVEVDYWTSQDCATNFTNYEIFDTTICGGYPEGGRDACQGDSGGPLLCPSDGSWVVAGVVSSGYGCARADYPGLYTNVAMYTDWISQNTD